MNINEVEIEMPEDREALIDAAVAAGDGNIAAGCDGGDDGLIAFIKRLQGGGQIVSSNDCTELELARAQACGRMWADDEGYGYVWFPEGN